MATFTFDGSSSQTVSFNATVDRVILDPDVDELASVSEDRDANTVTFIAVGGAVLTLTNTNLAALRANDGSVVAGFDSDIDLTIGNDNANSSINGNVVVGLGEDDRFSGTAGDDLLFGNTDDDRFDATTGSDRLYGGMGNDRIEVDANTTGAAAQTTLAVGGLGTDTVEIAGSFEGGGFDANFDADGTAYAGSATVFGGNEAGDPTDLADRIGVNLADNGSALIYGNGGSDSIDVRGSGDATVFGGLGDDGIAVALDVGLVYGGLGTDNIGVFLDGPGATATVFGGNGAADTVDGGDFIDVTGAAGSSATIYGNGGGDTITLDGGETSTARFTVYAGQGNDIVSGDLGNGSAVFGGIGVDNMDLDVFGAGPSAVSVYGGDGVSDTNDGADIITVSVGTGTTNGVAGDDTAMIFGNGGNDRITVDGEGGTVGQATVFGGAGNDTIDAGLILDGVVFGGIGNDVFGASDEDAAIADGSAVTVMDFTLGQDRVDFGATPTTSVQSITTAANVQIDDIGDAAGQIGFQIAAGGAVAVRVTSGELAGSTVVFGDADGEPGGDEVIVLSGFTGNLTTADFA